MVKKIFLIIALLLLIPGILGSTTTIKIKTLYSHRIYVASYVPEYLEPYSIIESFAFTSTGLGEKEYKINTDRDMIDLRITLKIADKKVLDERLKNISTGKTVYINYFPNNITISYEGEKNDSIEDPEEVNNQTGTDNESVQLNETVSPVETSDIVAETQKSITGKSVFENLYTKNKKTITYGSIIIIVFVVIVLAIFFIVKNKGPSFKKDTDRSSKIKFRHKDESEYSSTERELEVAEKKLKEAREEIDKVRKRSDMIKEAERKLDEDKKRLDDLRNGRF